MATPKGGEGLVALLVTVPRYVRLLIVMFFTVAVTFATFPIFAFVVALVMGITQDVNVYLSYMFTQDRSLALFYGGLSLVVGLGFYLWAWQTYVGTAGEPLAPSRRVVWVWAVGVLAVLLAANWLLQGALSLSAPPT